MAVCTSRLHTVSRGHVRLRLGTGIVIVQWDVLARAVLAGRSIGMLVVCNRTVRCDVRLDDVGLHGVVCRWQLLTGRRLSVFDVSSWILRKQHGTDDVCVQRCVSCRSVLYGRSGDLHTMPCRHVRQLDGFDDSGVQWSVSWRIHLSSWDW